MMAAIGTGLTSKTALWYTSRATGIILLLLLAAVMLLGLMVNRQGRLPGLPRFAVTGLHRNLSLLSLVFLVIHIVTAVADGFVSIPWISGIIPFTSNYRAFWLGMGAVAVDLMLAVILTSLVRGRIPAGLWRFIHWSSYVMFPVMIVHSIGSSPDLQSGWMLGLTVAVCILVGLGALIRAVAELGQTPRAARVAALVGHGRTD